MIQLLNPISIFFYSKVLPDLKVLFDSTSLKFELIESDNEIILTERYDKPPNSDYLEIPLKNILHSQLKNNLPDFSSRITTHPNLLKTFTLSFTEDEDSDDTLVKSISVIKGIAHKQSIVDAQQFVYSNILSLRPSSSVIYDFEPVCLTFLPENSLTIIVVANLENGEVVEIEYASLIPNVVQSINVSYGNIQKNFQSTVLSFLVFGQSIDKRITNKLLFRVIQNDYNRESFVYSNRLGGWDSISFIGENVEVHSINPLIANLKDYNIQYDLETTRIKRKNTGFIQSKEHYIQMLDFFQSEDKYVLEDGDLLPIVIRQFDSEYSKGSLNNFVFEYTFSNKLDNHISIDIAKSIINFQ